MIVSFRCLMKVRRWKLAYAGESNMGGRERWRRNKESIGLERERANERMLCSSEENFATDNWMPGLEADTRRMMMHHSRVESFSIICSSLLFENPPAIYRRWRWHGADRRLAVGRICR